MKGFLLGWCLAILMVKAQPANETYCQKMNDRVVAIVESGQLEPAEDLMRRFVSEPQSPSHRICAGLIYGNVASALGFLGRPQDAARLAEESIRTLEPSLPPGDALLVIPLQTLFAARFQLLEIGRARDALRKMERLTLDRPQDRAQFHGSSAALFDVEGRFAEAESEYLAALESWSDAGKANSASAGEILNALSLLYIRNKRYAAAEQTIERSNRIFTEASDVYLLDRIRLYQIRSQLRIERQQWHLAEADLRSAVNLAGDRPPIAGQAFERLLSDYAFVLRKNHHRQEAKAVEAQIGEVHNQTPSAAVVDLAELAAKRPPR